MNDATEVKLHFLDYWRVVKVRAGLIALSFFLVVVTTGVVVHFMPPKYRSTVKMEIKADRSNALGSGIFGPESRASDPYFIPTQFQILRTTEILYPVVEKLNLGKEWAVEGQPISKQRAYFKLMERLKLQEGRGTGLIDISVLDENAKLASYIANTIAATYSDKRLTDLKKNIDQALSQLRDEVDKQKNVVADLAAEAAKIRVRDSIFDPDPENATANLTIEDRNVLLLSEETNKKRIMVAELKGQLEQIQKMKPDELREALRTLGVEDATVIKMVGQYQDAVARQAILSASGLGENHPRMRSERSQIAVFQQFLADQLNTVRQTHATKVALAERMLLEVETKFNEAQENSQQDKKKMEEYTEAKTRYIQAKRIYEAAQIKLNTERMEKNIDWTPSIIWEKAEPAQFASEPNVTGSMVIAALGGLLLGVCLAFFIEYLDTSVKTLDDVERYLQLPVLAVVPKDVSILVRSQRESVDAEAYRILRANLEFNKPDPGANTYTLVSGGPGEGKSTTLNNLAYTCAKGGYRVLVVDADLRRPSQFRFFDVENEFGLTDYLQSQATIEEITKPTKIPNLSFIPSGPLPHSEIGILNSQRMVDLIQQVKTMYDLVFFDSPPILGVSDGSVLASECDITMMVVQHRRFPRAMLQRVKQAVQAARGHLIGVVLNNVDAKHDDGYTYYSNYNEYYAPRADRSPQREAMGAGVAPQPRQRDSNDY